MQEPSALCWTAAAGEPTDQLPLLLLLASGCCPVSQPANCLTNPKISSKSLHGLLKHIAEQRFDSLLAGTFLRGYTC